MKKLAMTIGIIGLFLAIIACTPEPVTTEELPDLSTYTEIEATQTMLNRIYKLVGVELTEENSIYFAVGEYMYKGTFIGLEDGDTLFSIEEDIDLQIWIDAYLNDEVRGYYK